MYILGRLGIEWYIQMRFKINQNNTETRKMDKYQKIKGLIRIVQE
jgi:hypothetical protein